MIDRKTLLVIAMTLTTVWLFRHYFSKDEKAALELGEVRLGARYAGEAIPATDGQGSIVPGQALKIPSAQDLYKPLDLTIAFDEKKVASEEIIDVETPYIYATLSTSGGVLSSLAFKEHCGKTHEPLQTVQPLSDASITPGCFFVALDKHTPYSYAFVDKKVTDTTVEVIFKAHNSYYTIQKTFIFNKGSYQVDLIIDAEARTKDAELVKPRLFFVSPLIQEVDNDVPTIIKWNEASKKLEKVDHATSLGAAWFWLSGRPMFGAEDRYFVHALINDTSEQSTNFVQRAYVRPEYKVVIHEVGAEKDKAVATLSKLMSMSAEETQLLLQHLPAVVSVAEAENEAYRIKNVLESAGIRNVQIDARKVYPILEGPALTAAKNTWNMSFYMGPKVIDHLTHADDRLEDVAAFGWLSWLCKLLIKLLTTIYDYVGNFGFAIIIMTILLKLPFAPLSIYGRKKMEIYQRYAPSITKIRTKYRHDLQMQQVELMKFYKDHNISPTSQMLGCLPLLIQAPILFALYRVLGNYLDLYQAPFVGWIVDLSAKDPYYVLPILMGVTMIWQQKLAPVADEKQRVIMLIMPIVMTALFASFPAGLVLYWLMNSILGIAEDYVRKFFFA